MYLAAPYEILMIYRACTFNTAYMSCRDTGPLLLINSNPFEKKLPRLSDQIYVQPANNHTYLLYFTVPRLVLRLCAFHRYSCVRDLEKISIHLQQRTLV